METGDRGQNGPMQAEMEQKPGLVFAITLLLHMEETLALQEMAQPLQQSPSMEQTLFKKLPLETVVMQTTALLVRLAFKFQT